MMKLAKRVKAALWTAVQFNREGIKKGKKGSAEGPDATHIAESIAVLFKATLVLTLNLLHGAEEGADIGYLDVRTEKYRFNSARPRLVVKLEYQHARLTELSEEDALMKRAQDQQEKFLGVLTSFMDRSKLAKLREQGFSLSGNRCEDRPQHDERSTGAEGSGIRLPAWNHTACYPTGRQVFKNTGSRTRRIIFV
jgi:hypothetical protein